MPRKLRDVLLFAFKILFNSILLAGAMAVALALRFDLQPGTIPSQYINILTEQILIYLILNALLFLKLSLYENIIETVSVNDLLKIVFSTGISSFALFIVGLIFDRMLPRTVYITTWVLSVFFIGGYMLFLRIVKNELKSRSMGIKNQERIMLVGTNDNTLIVINYLALGTSMGRAVVIIDHEGSKVGKRIKDIKVAGLISDIPQVVKRYNVTEIILCFDETQLSLRSDTIKICLETGCKLKSFFNPAESLQSGVNVGLQRFRKIDYSDLLARSEVKLDTTVCDYLRDKTILITGGGGSIGSELCRQICLYKPKKIIIFDIYENNAYDLQQELHVEYGDYIDICIRIGSVRDIARLDSLFNEFRPSVVFHAAAHKHVPLMEDSPGEALKNNIMGTYNTALTAIKYNVSKFILLSTDKAVNASSIMGASKRVCEMIIQSRTSINTVFAAVRFGNVLGSNGSVIPLFQKQIEAGGPVTVVHPDITRYFMTIPEAAQLVVQAGGLALGGEIFILEMGEPVKILDLARNLIRLSGYEPGVDIKIDFVGLRPGEKMHEELSFDYENSSSTSNEKIFITNPVTINSAMLETHIRELREVLQHGADEYKIRKLLNTIVFNDQDDSPIFPARLRKSKYEPLRIDLLQDIG